MNRSLLIGLLMLPLPVCTAVTPSPTAPAKPGTPSGYHLILPTPTARPVVIPRPPIVNPPDVNKIKVLPKTIVIPGDAQSEPVVPAPKARFLVYRDDDRAVTRTFHPLLTPQTRVNVLPANAVVRPVSP